MKVADLKCTVLGGTPVVRIVTHEGPAETLEFRKSLRLLPSIGGLWRRAAVNVVAADRQYLTLSGLLASCGRLLSRQGEDNRGCSKMGLAAEGGM